VTNSKNKFKGDTNLKHSQTERTKPDKTTNKTIFWRQYDGNVRNKTRNITRGKEHKKKKQNYKTFTKTRK
jgi:hypothetical protein